MENNTPLSRAIAQLSAALPLVSLPLLTLPIVALPASAQEQAIELNNMVVSAAGFEQKVADAPASVTLVEREQLQSKPYGGLADALRDIEGIDVGTGTDKNGNIAITMRGLPADYTLVLIDGRRQSDVGDIGPNNFGNSQFMYMPPLSAIERIEVVRGPMSTLYGSDAIGGVINIITRKVTDKWGGSITQSLTLQEESRYGDDKKTDLYVSGPLIEDTLGLALRGSLYDRQATEPALFSERLSLPELDANGNPNVPAFYEDSGNFGSKQMVAAQTWNAGVTLNWTPTEQQDISLEYDMAKQRYNNTQGQTGTLDGVESLWRADNAGIVQPRVGYAEYQRTEREQFALTHTGRWSMGTTDISLSHLRSQNLGRSLPLTVQERAGVQAIWDANCPTVADCAAIPNDQVRDQLEDEFLPRQRRELEVRNTTLDAKFDTQIQAHTLSLGGQYIDAEMEDGVFGMDGGGFQDGAAQPHRQWALFAEDHWGLTPDFTLTTGVRLDDHNIYGSNTSPRVYGTWRTNANWTLKGGVSTGYKTPKPNQLYPGIVGFGRQGTMPFVGTPGLEPETSLNYELAAYFDNLDGLSANITLFHNEFKDKIARGDQVPNCYASTGERVRSEGCVDVGPGWAELGFTEFSQSVNIDEAITSGVELSGQWQFASRWLLKGNYTYTDSEQKSGADEGYPLVNTPEHMANATLRWQAAERLSLSLVSEIRGERYRRTSSQYRGSELDPALYKAYELLHFGARFEASEQLTFNARINNLLDNDLSDRSCVINEEQNEYNCYDDYNSVQKARSFWLSANMSF